MKSYTDINQSRELAEILPLESADMYYHPYPNDEDWYDVPNIGNADLKYNQLPCWSLAALLNVINQVREIFYQRVTFLVGRYAGGHWYVEVLRVQDERSVVFEHSKELVDACVEMILKLHELKLL